MERDDARVAQALAMMKNALNLLDLAGAGFTSFACHLSMAIDVAEGRPTAGDDANSLLLIAELERAQGVLPRDPS